MTDISTLRGVLRFNALFSGISGIVLVVFSAQLADSFGVARTLLLIVGVGLIGFAVFVWMTASNQRPLFVKVILAGDIAWVVGAVIIIAIPETMTTTGKLVLGVVTLVVLVLAVAQGRALSASE